MTQLMDRPPAFMEVPTHLLDVEPGFSGIVQYQDSSLVPAMLSTWSIVFNQGRFVFVSHSFDPLERLDRHLRRLSHQVSSLTREVCLRIRRQAESILSQETGPLPADFLTLIWMVEEHLLPREAARKLSAWMSEEVLQNLLLSRAQNLERQQLQLDALPTLGQWEVGSLLSHIQKRLEAWQALGPQITSPYQRPYFTSRAQAERLPPDQQEHLSQLLRGFNFRQLSALIDQDELLIARRLYPLINAGIVILRDPQAPFDKLPKTHLASVATVPVLTRNPTPPPQITAKLAEGLQDLRPAPKATQTWTVACIDDSQAMLNEICRLLEGQNLAIHTISDSLKALMKLTSLKPNLILLDVGMPNIDGYQLCGLIRKSSVLKEVPVVMVTGHKGLIDRVKARMAGATDYLTKPFQQEELLQIVFRYLS
jgi:chemotaxis family two-component system response regulator PixG